MTTPAAATANIKLSWQSTNSVVVLLKS